MKKLNLRLIFKDFSFIPTFILFKKEGKLALERSGLFRLRASDLLINSAGYNQCWALSKSDIAALPPVPHHTSFHISSVLTARLSQRSSPTPPVFYLPNIPKGPRSAPWAGVVRHWVQSKNILKNHVYIRIKVEFRIPLTFYDLNLSAQDHQTFFCCDSDAGRDDLESKLPCSQSA